MDNPRPRVAIVGAGPAGAFAAARLLRERGGVEIDLFERLPTPWGLVRSGVAPDTRVESLAFGRTEIVARRTMAAVPGNRSTARTGRGATGSTNSSICS